MSKGLKMLVLPCNQSYFLMAKKGGLHSEYRHDTAYWQKRIENKSYSCLVLANGYPKRTIETLSDENYFLFFNFAGFKKQNVSHPSWGSLPVSIFITPLNKMENSLKESIIKNEFECLQ